MDTQTTSRKRQTSQPTSIVKYTDSISQDIQLNLIHLILTHDIRTKTETSLGDCSLTTLLAIYQSLPKE